MRLLRHIQATLDKTLLSRQQPSQLTCADTSVKVVKYSENVACPQSWQIYECSCLMWLQGHDRAAGLFPGGCSCWSLDST